MTTGTSAFTHSKTFIMTQIAYTLLALNLCFILTAQVVESQHVPKTCQCPQVQKRVRGPFSDLRITPKGPSCLQNEIIVTPKKTNKPVCLSPEGPQGKSLMKCWNRTQKAGINHKICLRPRQRKGKQVKSKKITS
uniref:Growth-regulated alpha protein-like n=2 Tax=Danio rerio TaxID=7955 RepID=A0A2R8QN98_DANRE|nr:growth-regulated alpha protein-like [Danio rerio]|eukprot:XP_005157000.1 growth-regulated alpha protein-like [Danio rerio]